MGLCVFGLPCPLKRALINGHFINQELLAGSKRLWGQGSVEVLNQFPNPPGLDKFCFLAAGQFIIILPLRHNGTGKKKVWKWEEGNWGNKGEWSRDKVHSLPLYPATISLFFCPPLHSVSSSHSPLSFFLSLLKSLDTLRALNARQAHSSRAYQRPQIISDKAQTNVCRIHLLL